MQVIHSSIFIFEHEEYDIATSKKQYCLASIRSKVTQNQLRLNDGKTEFMMIGKPNSQKYLPPEGTIKIGDEHIVV